MPVPQLVGGLRVLSFFLGVRVRAPSRQLLKEGLFLKSTFYSCSPPTVASSLRALRAPSHCLCARAHAHVRTQAHAGLWEVEWSAQEDRVHLQVCYPWETPLDSPGKRTGPLLGPRNRWVKMGILPTMPAHHFQHKRPLVAARDRHFTQSNCPYGQSQAATSI